MDSRLLASLGPGMTVSTCRADQPFGGGAGFGGDLGAGQHARDLLAAMVGGERVDAGGDALALVERVLRDQQMLAGTCGNLRRVRHRHHLHLAGEAQVMAVTHVPQVAARADQHLLISKDALDKGKRVATRVNALAADHRREEIARMLAGAEITAEARAAAERLLKAASAA